MTITQELLEQHKGLARLGYELGAEIDEEKLNEVLLSATRVELDAQTQAVEDLGAELTGLEAKRLQVEGEKALAKDSVTALTALLADLESVSE